MSVISKIGLGLVAACAVFAFLVTRDPESGIPDRTLAAVGLRSIATPSSVVRESLAKGGPGSLALNAKREREATTNIAAIRSGERSVDTDFKARRVRAGAAALSVLNLADTTPAGSEMLNTCLARSGNSSKSSFSMKPASVTRFIECYLTVNEKRLCNEVQRRVLMDVTDLMQIAIMASAKPKPGEPNQVLPEWDLPVNKSNAAALTSLFKRGYLTASDMEWAPPDMVDAHYGLGVFTPNPCVTALR